MSRAAEDHSMQATVGQSPPSVGAAVFVILAFPEARTFVSRAGHSARVEGGFMIVFSAPRLVVIAVLFIGSADARAVGNATEAQRHDGSTTVQVAGSGWDSLNTALVNSQELTQTGLIQKSTEIVELRGDLKGRVLYHVTSVFDFVDNTLVNTGDQVYSGTILGSSPVMIHDDQFRFEINLATGQESGQVYLFDHIAGPKVRCALNVVGTGLNTDDNPTFTYSGRCTFRGQ